MRVPNLFKIAHLGDLETQGKDLMISRLLCFLMFSVSSVACFAQKSEQDIGKDIVALYLGAAGLHDDIELQTYVQSLGMYLTEVAGASDEYDWKFAVMDDGGINAFAAPGGYVLITKGLFDLLSTEDALAFVLAHEINHVLKKHHLKVIQDQERMALVVSKMQESLNVNTELLSNMNSLFKDMTLKGLDKNAEFESDVAGMELSVKAGYSSSAGFDVLFDFLEEQETSNDELFFKTHPTPSDRIDVLTLHMTIDYESRDAYSFNSSRINDYK